MAETCGATHPETGVPCRLSLDLHALHTAGFGANRVTWARPSKEIDPPTTQKGRLVEVARRITGRAEESAADDQEDPEDDRLFVSTDLSEDTTLAQARAWLRDRVDVGETCPCCSQMAKVYRRSIHSTMARSLVLAYHTHEREWFHLATLTRTIGRGGEEGKLRYWGLLDEETERRPDGGRSGWWRVTERGEDFVCNRIRVPKYALVYDGRLVELDDSEQVSIIDALGEKFSYNELMGRSGQTSGPVAL